jgi:AcrR family transcriptional regulator
MATMGRPRVSSQAVLEEAATELFLEQGYQATSIDDIASRAGVSRATFFNYFGGKADVLLVEIDRALDAFGQAVRATGDIAAAIVSVASSITRSDIPLLAQQADTMGATDDVTKALLERFSRLKDHVAGSVTEPVWQWAVAGAIAEGASRWATDRDGGSLLGAITDAVNQLPPEFTQKPDQ